MDFYAVYDTSNGFMHWKSSGPDGTAAIQQIPDGTAIIEMPYDAFIALPGDLGPLKTSVIALVDQGAGAFRKLFITDIPGQQATYLAKEQEARAWTSDGDASKFPYLSQEATDTNTTIDAVAAQIIATADQWRALDPKIEGKRRGASVAITAADNIAAIVAAGTINWADLIAPATS